jgi:hypothetical protein
MASKPRRAVLGMTPFAPPIAALVLAVALVAAAALAACGGKVDASTAGGCNAPSLAWCGDHGCPATGPSASAIDSVTAWCAANPSIAARVTGFGTCTAPDSTTWANDVKIGDGTGGAAYLLYDPTSGQLVHVTTVDPSVAGQGDGGAEQTDYGTCGVHGGVVTCHGAAFRCGG